MLPIYSSSELPDEWCKYYNTISGYRYNYNTGFCIMSIFDKRHNEFWMIWSDICPLIIFSYISVKYQISYDFYCLNNFYQLHCSLVLFAIVISRLCSVLYHIFQCLSIRTNNSLINFDLMGICQGALGSPYFMARLLRISDWNDNVFKIYVYILLTLYCICMFFFGYLLITNSKNSCIKKISIYNLLILATFGNAPLICIGLNNSFPITIRMYCFCGPISLTLGYIIYLYNIPEVFLKEGVLDGKIWNSHVIWHNFVTISQICFCSCAITNIY